MNAAGVMICCGDRILLVQRGLEGDFPGYWAFPAGGIEGTETPEQAARREILEELGYTCGALELVSFVGGFSTFREIVESEFCPVLNPENTSFIWSTTCAMPSPLHPGVKAYFDSIASCATDFNDTGYSARVPDQNGWIEIKRNPISKVGVFPYRGSSIGAPEADKIYMVYRPASELGAPECIESFRLLPWIDNHVMLGPNAKQITNAAVSAEEKGISGVIGEQTEFDNGDGILYGNIKLFSDSMGKSIGGGKRELSAGYRCSYDFTPGEYLGVPYDAVQRNIRGNHLALVNEGRCGPEIAVLDTLTITFDEKDFVMDKTTDVPKKEDSGEGGMTLAEMSKTLGEIVPAIAKINELLAGLTKPAAAATDPVVDTVPGDKPADATAPAMDEAAITRRVIGDMNLRSKLLSDVTHFTGTFAADEMNTKEVAKYAVKKLGIPCVDGAEVVAVQAWLHGREIPTKAVVTTDAKPSGTGAVTATYAKE